MNKTLTRTHGAKPKKKKLLQREIKAELVSVLQVALYDLAKLNAHDPLYVPRCQSRAHNILLECGIDKIQVPFVGSPITTNELLPQVLVLLRSLLAEKPPVYKSPQVSFHASNLISFLKLKGVQVVASKNTDTARSSEEKTKVSKARKKVRSQSRSSKSAKRTR